MSGLSREVLKWVQGLDLTWKIKVPKWDLTNGYLVAEIFSWYFGQDIHMYSFYSCSSLEVKQHNWYIIKQLIRSKHLDIPQEYIEGTIHCKEGAATLLLERMYEILTTRPVKKVPPEIPTEYTDYAYQVKLPMYARSTATKAVKNNLRLTEVLQDENQLHTSEKCQKIIKTHMDHRRIERLEDPDRFDIKPTLAERCTRSSPPVSISSGEQNLDKLASDLSVGMVNKEQAEDDVSLPVKKERSVHFKEVQVKQTDKSTICTIPIPGC